MNEAVNEEARMSLLHLRALSAAVESTGQAKAEAEVRKGQWVDAVIVIEAIEHMDCAVFGGTLLSGRLIVTDVFDRLWLSLATI